MRDAADNDTAKFDFWTLIVTEAVAFVPVPSVTSTNNVLDPADPEFHLNVLDV